jgi:hypothetical protein
MPPPAGRVWTTTKKVLGNVLPLVLSSTLLVTAVLEFARSGPSTRLIGWIGLFLGVAWVFLLFLGLIGNGSMRREMGRRLHIERPFDKTERYFVGFARPAYKSTLDPHEDVGFLLLHDDEIEFYGSEHKLVLSRPSVTGACYRANTHTLVGLGRWVSIEGIVEEKPVRLLVEPRVKATLLGNLLFSRTLLKRIEKWKEEGPGAEAPSPS